MIGVHTALSQAGRAAATGAAVLLVLATGLLASCGGAEDPGTGQNSAGQGGDAVPSGPPPIDLRAPADFETASFAFG